MRGSRRSVRQSMTMSGFGGRVVDCDIAQSCRVRRKSCWCLPGRCQPGRGRAGRCYQPGRSQPGRVLGCRQRLSAAEGCVKSTLL